MGEEKQPEKTITGLFWLMTSMYHHYTLGIRNCISKQYLDKKMAAEIRARTKGLEKDLNTLRIALDKIETIAKRENYEEIRKIIEDETYENGFEQRHQLK